VDAQVDGGADDGCQLVRGDDEGPLENFIVESRVARCRCARGATECVTDLEVCDRGEGAGRGEGGGEDTMKGPGDGDGRGEPGVQQKLTLLRCI